MAPRNRSGRRDFPAAATHAAADGAVLGAYCAAAVETDRSAPVPVVCTPESMRHAVSSLETSGSDAPRPVQRSHWWREVLIVAAFYFLYSLVRDVRGDKPVSIEQARTNANRIISLERHLSAFHEATIQHWFLGDREFIRLCDDFYGSAHFVAVVAVLLVLFFWYPSRYRLMRNTLALTTGLALVGFFFFPLLPPRLLPAQYHFVDTLQVIGGLLELLVRSSRK